MWCIKLALPLFGGAVRPVQSRTEYAGVSEPVGERSRSDLSMSRLGARVQHGLTPMKLRLSIWSGSLAPKVMVKWLNISWCLRFWSVSGRWLGWIFLFFLFRLASLASLAASLLLPPRRPKVNVRASLLLVDLCSDEVSLVFAVVVVVLLSVWEMVSDDDDSDLRMARRK